METRCRKTSAISLSLVAAHSVFDDCTDSITVAQDDARQVCSSQSRLVATSSLDEDEDEEEVFISINNYVFGILIAWALHPNTNFHINVVNLKFQNKIE